MVDTPNLEITHPEQSSQALVPLNAALDDFDGAVAGFLIIAMADSNRVLTDEEALREAVLEFTGALSAGRTITLPDNQKTYWVWNNTTGGFSLTFDTPSGAETVVVAAGEWAKLAVDPGFDVNLMQSINPQFADLTLSGQLFKSVTNSITAGTTQTQAGATALTADINRVTVVGDSGDGVKLPTAVAGAEVLIVNEDAVDALQVWPAGGDKIDGGSADAVDPIELEAGGSRKYFSVDGTDWYTGVQSNPQTVFISHTAGADDDHAVEIRLDAAGFGDVKAVDIDYITGAIAATDLAAGMVIDFDGTGASAGIAIGLEVLTTRGGLDNIYGLLAGAVVAPVLQLSGVFADADTALNKAVDVQAAWADGGAGNITVFVADNDTITIGDASKFEEIEFELGTGASGAGVAPTFEYSTGVGTWQAFAPTDGTNGFRNTGVVVWLDSQVSSPAFVAGTGGKYRIRITRTRNSLATTPIIDEVQISADVEFSWDKDGNISINDLIAAGNLLLNGTVTPTSAAGVLTIGNGTMGSALVNTMQIGSQDLSAGNTMLALQGEGTPEAAGAATIDRTVAIEINGTTRYFMVSDTAAA